uniref:Stomatal closure-related actin-binding protein Ig domain-containing protein n=1 Tax=Aegilops tauschii subsp. strangulata TaxID=200361 RepID=A0A453AXM6_AEGTS
SCELEGLESLGSMLRVVVRNDVALSNSSVQWFRIQPKGHKKEIISGATKLVYAPEPHDVGRYLQAEVNLGGETSVAKTAGPLDPAPGLVDYVETLVRNPETDYNGCCPSNERNRPTY